MIVEWAKGLFWLWFAGTVGWIIAVSYIVYEDTKAFSLHLSSNEWTAFILLWSLPPLLTFGVYLVVLWFGERLIAKDDLRWDREGSRRPENRFQRRG